MDFTLPQEALDLREEVRSLIQRVVTPELIRAAHDSGTDWCPPLARELGSRGILERAVDSLCVGDAVECWVLLHELHAAGIPQDAIAQSVVTAAIVQRAGTPLQRQRMQPGLLAGEELACFALTEADAGSDLAAISTRAHLDGDVWVVSGAKMWTTMAHVADWVLLLARSDPAGGRYDGFTMFLFPASTPGFSCEPIRTISTERSNATFYDEVRIGREHVLGEEHQGWRTLGVMLGVERGVANTAFNVPLMNRLLRWAGDAGRADDPAVRALLARMAIDAEVSKLLSQRAVWMSEGDGAAATAGSEAKLFATEAYQQSAAALQALAAPESLVGLGDPSGAAAGWIDYDARHAVPQTIQGGTSEINRNNIAERRLGLPRAR